MGHYFLDIKYILDTQIHEIFIIISQALITQGPWASTFWADLIDKCGSGSDLHGIQKQFYSLLFNKKNMKIFQSMMAKLKKFNFKNIHIILPRYRTRIFISDPDPSLTVFLHMKIILFKVERGNSGLWKR